MRLTKKPPATRSLLHGTSKLTLFKPHIALNILHFPQCHYKDYRNKTVINDETNTGLSETSQTTDVATATPVFN